MNPVWLLRIASVFSLLYCAGHTSGMPWMSPDGPETAALTESMKQYRFDMMGATRTVWDFHVGFGLVISVDLLLQAVALWMLATMAKSDAPRIRPLIALFAIASVANAVLVGRHFFVIPLVTATAIAICLGLAFLAARPKPAVS